MYKMALKFIWKFMGPRIFKTVLKTMLETILSKIKTYKATIIKSVVLCNGIKQPKELKWNPVDSHVCNELI